MINYCFRFLFSCFDFLWISSISFFVFSLSINLVCVCSTFMFCILTFVISSGVCSRYSLFYDCPSRVDLIFFNFCTCCSFRISVVLCKFLFVWIVLTKLRFYISFIACAVLFRFAKDKVIYLHFTLSACV